MFTEILLKYNEPVDKIVAFSCLVYLTNAAHAACIGAPYLYIQSFLILVATSVIYRLFNTKITRFIDRIAIANLIFHGSKITFYGGGEAAATVGKRPSSAQLSIIVLCFLIVVFVFIKDNIKRRNDFEASVRHAIFIHLVSSIGHHIILRYSI